MTGTLEGVFAAAAFFVASHILLASTEIRAALVQRFGETAFRVLFSVVATAALAWLVVAYATAPYAEVWPATLAARYVPLVVMPFASVLLVCGLTTRNPTAIGGGPPPSPSDDPAPGIIKVTRHPFLWAVALWALAHIPPNGDVASLALFVAIAILAFAGMPLLDRKHENALGPSWGPIALTTSTLPFAALASGRATLRFSDIGTWRILLGVVVYLTLLLAHRAVIGVSPLPMG